MCQGHAGQGGHPTAHGLSWGIRGWREELGRLAPAAPRSARSSQNSRNVSLALDRIGIRAGGSLPSLPWSKQALGQELGWDRPWAPPPGRPLPPPTPEGPPSGHLRCPLVSLTSTASARQLLQWSLGLTPGHCDSRPPSLPLWPGTGCTSSQWGWGDIREGKWLWLVAPHVAGWGMANSTGGTVQGPGESGGKTPGGQQLWPAPPRTQETLHLPAPQIRPERAVS